MTTQALTTEPSSLFYYDELDKEIIKDHARTFGIFVGFFNKANGTELTVKQAKQIDELVQLYEGVKECVVEMRNQIDIQPNKSTRRKSYDATNIPDLDHEVFVYVYNHTKATRAEIAKGTKRRMSSICGACSRLVESRLLYVCGTKQDFETNREVEVLSIGNI